MSVAELPEEAFVAGLLTLHAMWPARLAALLGIGADRVRRPARDAWGIVRTGSAAGVAALARLVGPDAEALAAHWAAAAERVDLPAIWDGYRRRHVLVDVVDGPGYPVELAGDKAPPVVVFRSGARADLGGRRVAVVGTRRCTPLGRDVAFEFGAALADAGIRVVSGLALGTDAAVHQGALQARRGAPIGVVAGGLDVPYPSRHRPLWQQVAGAGALVTEWPLGTPSEGWRFPARNRIVAALAEAVLVVESKEVGGSMITASEAAERGVPVLAVPGSIRNPLAAGTNALIRDGAVPVCGIDDVFAALSLTTVVAPAPARPAPSAGAVPVLAALGWEPTPLEVLVIRTGLDPAGVALQLTHLELDGWVSGGGGWWQRIA